MLSRAQQILLKRAQAEALMDDADYRDAIATVSGMPDCRSSTDLRLTDRNMDKLMGYFEAIYWRKVDANNARPGTGLQHVFKPTAIFRKRGFWASKNPSGNTSRDRYTISAIGKVIEELERALTGYGCGLAYFQGIQNRMRRGGKEFSLVQYAGALKRTLAAKQRASGPDPDNVPF